MRPQSDLSALETTRWAIQQGAEHVALIPLRGSELDRLEVPYALPHLSQLEDAFDACLLELEQKPKLQTVISVDLWDLEKLATCNNCFKPRRQRLERMQKTGQPEPRLGCASCDSDGL